MCVCVCVFVVRKGRDDWSATRRRHKAPTFDYFVFPLIFLFSRFPFLYVIFFLFSFFIFLFSFLFSLPYFLLFFLPFLYIILFGVRC